MSFAGKIQRIRNFIHVNRLRYKNRKADFNYAAEGLNPKVNIQMVPGSKCYMKQLYAGRGGGINRYL